MAIRTMLFKFVLFAVLLFSTCASPANVWTAEGWLAGRSRPDTNANRLSRGLTPVPPKRLYNATRIGPPQSRRSTTPVSGQITVTEVDASAPLCWIGELQTCVSQPSGLTFVASVGEGASTPQELTVTSGVNAGFTLILGSFSDTPQGRGTGNVLYVLPLSSSEHTAPGAVPSYDPAQGLYYESSVWTINSEGDITATWVNSDGTTVSLFFFVDVVASGTYLDASGDPALMGNPMYPIVTFQI